MAAFGKNNFVKKNLHVRIKLIFEYLTNERGRMSKASPRKLGAGRVRNIAAIMRSTDMKALSRLNPRAIWAADPLKMDVVGWAVLLPNQPHPKTVRSLSGGVDQPQTFAHFPFSAASPAHSAFFTPSISATMA
jgi:hypothetical protein